MAWTGTVSDSGVHGGDTSGQTVLEKYNFFLCLQINNNWNLIKYRRNFFNCCSTIHRRKEVIFLLTARTKVVLFLYHPYFLSDIFLIKISITVMTVVVPRGNS